MSACCHWWPQNLERYLGKVFIRHNDLHNDKSWDYFLTYHMITEYCGLPVQMQEEASAKAAQAADIQDARTEIEALNRQLQAAKAAAAAAGNARGSAGSGSSSSKKGVEVHFASCHLMGIQVKAISIS